MLESLPQSVKKFVPALALLTGLAGCAAETEPTQEEKITASLQVLDRESDALMKKFEAAVEAALQSGQVFEEIPGREPTVVHDGETFNCVDWNTKEEQVFCETGKVDVLTTNPNLVSVDRKESVTLFVAEKDLPVLQMKNNNNKSGDQAQEAVSIFLNPNSCTVNDNGDASFSRDTEIVQRCITLRDKLRKRMVSILQQIAFLKKIGGK